MKRYLMLFLFILLAGVSGYGQKKAPNPVRVSGVVLDADDREQISYVSIRIAGTMYGTAADNNGYFSIFINPGDTLLFSSDRLSGCRFYYALQPEI